jgi:hypothetical protein
VENSLKKFPAFKEKKFERVFLSETIKSLGGFDGFNEF